MSEDIVKRLREPCFFNGYDQQTSEEAADEIERLRKYEQLVNFIATDYVELSHDKVQNDHRLCSNSTRLEETMADFIAAIVTIFLPLAFAGYAILKIMQGDIE